MAKELKVSRNMHVIAVPSLEASAAYYASVLGFEVEELAPGWRMYALDSCRIMAGECPDATPPHETGDHSYFAYIVLEDVAAYFGVVKDKAELIKDLRDEPWGMREFGVRTADGHRIMFGQDI